MCVIDLVDWRLSRQRSSTRIWILESQAMSARERTDREREWYIVLVLVFYWFWSAVFSFDGVVHSEELLRVTGLLRIVVWSLRSPWVSSSWWILDTWQWSFFLKVLCSSGSRLPFRGLNQSFTNLGASRLYPWWLLIRAVIGKSVVQEFHYILCQFNCLGCVTVLIRRWGLKYDGNFEHRKFWAVYNLLFSVMCMWVFFFVHTGFRIFELEW